MADEVLEMAKFYEEIEMLEDVENKLSSLQDEMKQVTVFKNDLNSLLKQIKNLWAGQTFFIYLLVGHWILTVLSPLIMGANLVSCNDFSFIQRTMVENREPVLIFSEFTKFLFEIFNC